MAKRIKTEYPGVVYLESTSKAGKPEKVFYIFYRKDGKQIEEKVGRSIRDNMTPAKANRIRAERIEGRQLSNNERRDAERAAKEAEAGRWTIKRIFDAYDAEHSERACAVTDRGNFTHIPDDMKQKTPAELVTLDIERLRRVLEKKKSSRTGKNISAQTQKHILALIKRIIRWASDVGHIEAASHLKFEMPKLDNEKTEFMNEAQIQAYIKALDEEPSQDDAAFFRLALLTGVRKNALLNLKWSDVDFQNGRLTLRGEVSKNGKTQKIPLSAGALAVLSRITRRESDYVWPGAKDGHRGGFRNMGKRLRAKAGLPPDFRPVHGLRHHFASHLVSSGASLYETSALLTHGDVSMTKRYAHLSNQALKRAASLADSILDAGKDNKIVEIGGK